MNDQTAAVGAGVTAAMAATSWLTTINEIMQIGSAAVAIVAGIVTAWYYIDRILAARRSRKQ